jgi:hypothetical protein
MTSATVRIAAAGPAATGLSQPGSTRYSRGKQGDGILLLDSRYKTCYTEKRDSGLRGIPSRLCTATTLGRSGALPLSPLRRCH